MKRKAHGAAVIALLLASVSSVDGCSAGPPVQEMSDARQAISVAKEAGAATVAPDELKQAEALLSDAQKNLADRAYSQARRNATQAKEKALQALSAVERPE
jgi:Domain of unknown function (DUF4398)